MHNCSLLALNITFGKSQYSFTEKDGTVNIHVQISNPVARNFSVEIKKSKAAIKMQHILNFIKSWHFSFCKVW